MPDTKHGVQFYGSRFVGTQCHIFYISLYVQYDSIFGVSSYYPNLDVELWVSASCPSKLGNISFDQSCHQYDVAWVCHAQLQQDIFYARGDNSYYSECSCTGPFCRLMLCHKGLQEAKAPQANNVWLRLYNFGIWKWGQALIKVGTMQVPHTCTTSFLHDGWAVAWHTAWVLGG